MNLKFDKGYFGLAVLIFAIEILIAKFAHDPIIRPYIGDFLVVILIYCLVKSFLNTLTSITAIGVLIFSYTIECLQYFQIVHKLGLQDFKMARIIIGTSFSWMDILAYTIGIGLVLYIEKRRGGCNL